MIKCPDCGAMQYVGTLFCTECGCFLIQTAPASTAQLPFVQHGRLPSPPSMIKESALQPPTDSAKVITAFIPGSRKRLQLELRQEIRVGRATDDPDTTPEMDLTPFNAAAHGVSRLHAMLQLTTQGVALIDLDSTNGTYLNNYRLTAHQPYLLANGDEVLFGDLLVHFFFDME